MDNVVNAGVDVTPGEFLKAIFGDAASEAWVASVDSLEPGRVTNSQFFGGRFRSMRLNPNANCYYSMGLIAPGRDKSRKAMHWQAGPVVVLDDVYEKGDGTAVAAAFGAPSFIVQTSPESHQWGYILREPVTDPLLMARLLRACTLAFYPSGKDPGHEPIVQYVRLPYGVNNKTKRLRDGVAPKVTLTAWHPERKFEVLDLIMALGDAWDRAESDVARSTAEGFQGVRSEQEARAAEDADDILRGLDALNMVHWDRIQNGGYIEIECPWACEHAVSDDRTGYNPALAATGEAFSCFHSSHGPKHDHDVREWLAKELGATRWHAICEEAYRAKSATANFPDNVEEMNRLVLDLKAELRAARTPPMVWREFGAGVPVEAMPARKVICPWLIRGEVTVLAAQPGTGKSLLSIAIAMAVSANRPELIGEREFDRAGSVFIVSNEDPFDEVMRRRNGWLKHNGIEWKDLKYRNWTNSVRGIRIVERLDRRAPVEATEELRRLGTRIEETRAAGEDVCLVVFDTTSTVFSGIEENDNAAVAQAMTVVASWAQKHNVAVLLLHHMPKATGKAGGSGDMFAVRGASAMIAAARCIVTLVGLSDAEEENLPPPEKGRWVKMKGAKSSFNRTEDVRYFYKLGVNVDADDERSLSGTVPESAGVIEYRRDKPFTFDPKSEETVFKALCVVRDGDADGQPYSVTRRPKGYTALHDGIRRELHCTPADADAVVDYLVDSGLVETEYVWSVERNKVHVYVLVDKGKTLIEERETEQPF